MGFCVTWLIVCWREVLVNEGEPGSNEAAANEKVFFFYYFPNLIFSFLVGKDALL